MSENLPSLSGDNSLARYLREIRRYPILEHEEEYILAKAWQMRGDRSAAHKLVTSHLRLVAKVALGYRGYGLPIADLISEGILGMMQAVKRFDPDRGFRLSTYALWWIRASIQEYVLRSWSLVRVGSSSAQRRLFFNLGRLRDKIEQSDKPGLLSETTRKISQQLRVPEEETIRMSQRLSGGDVSLNAPLPAGEGTWQDWLADESENQETQLVNHQEMEYQKRLLYEEMQKLSLREQKIIQARRLSDEIRTLQELADKFSVSKERIRQIESRALQKLQKAIAGRLHSEACA